MIETIPHIGESRIRNSHKKITGNFTEVDSEVFYKIEHFDAMPPFFMTVVSATDHWLFVASNGGISAGRKNANHSLFPYYTDDKIVDTAEITGSKTIFKIHRNGVVYIWEPFSDRYEGIYSCQRNLYKNKTGNKILFEETNSDLDITFRYMWTFSERFGFVKKSTLINHLDKPVKVELLDGVQNILPYGVDSDLQGTRSNLVDAYKKNELDSLCNIGIFSLSAMIVDKAEASEALSATVAWTAGISAECFLLSSAQLSSFRKGLKIATETDVRAKKGAFFIHSKTLLRESTSISWFVVCEVNQSHADIVNLQEFLLSDSDKIEAINTDVQNGTQALKMLVAKADGLQKSNDELITGRHFSNVLFNIMRGGIFVNQYQIDLQDLKNYFHSMNKKVAENALDFFNQLSPKTDHQTLMNAAYASQNEDIIRLSLEYLPLYFSRRHGDPSRPWNYFSIETRDDLGNQVLSYEGNWRDIFQNWEATALSFPSYVESMIAKFVNASTVDGYNPYRISRDGIDWEVIDEHDPWAHIGYWGDHQIVYLMKLLEISNRHHPERLVKWLNNPLFVYANVPYRIKSYSEILADPRNTIHFDTRLEGKIQDKVRNIGGDGKLVLDGMELPIRATLTEKILVTMCTKLYNFVPEGGIWLNTQRPEWNDANNALVGNGVSMVTLYYLRRFLKLFGELIGKIEGEHIVVNQPVAVMVNELHHHFSSHRDMLNATISDINRKVMMDELGKMGEKYREAVYSKMGEETHSLKVSAISELITLGMEYIDHTIRLNRRDDGLYHSYNLVEFRDKTASVKPLYEMLEGQVAILSADYLNAEEARSVLDALKRSDMFRPDQYSYMLYPNRTLPTFLTKNTIPANFAIQSKLLQKLKDNNNKVLVEVDQKGEFHFCGKFNNAENVVIALNQLREEGYKDLVNIEYQMIMDAFEDLFNHKSFTGRSGTFYGYEGLGCIYWHMVSKLSLACQENIFKAYRDKADPVIIGNLVDHYYEIRAGIGVNKTPELYGAFPTDAYSHTPGNAGAKQPGMTGQVKEDIINRWAELGVVVNAGCLNFTPQFLNKFEFLESAASFSYYDVHDQERKLELAKNSMAFTYCQVPIVYVLGDEEFLLITLKDGQRLKLEGHQLHADLSEDIFERGGKVVQVDFHFRFD